MRQFDNVGGMENLSADGLLSEPEQHRALMEWNSTQMDYPRDACIQDLVESQVERTPDAVAVTFEGDCLTYRGLNARANQLARHLRKVGVGPEVLVGIHVERSLQMLVGLLGVLKAGGAYVPLDPAYPKDRLAFIAKDAQLKTLLTEQHLAMSAPGSEARLLCLDDNWQTFSEQEDTNLPREVRPDNLAYAVYTSGSTGKPKGVQIEHRNVVNFLCSLRQQPGLNQQDVLVALTTLSFDIAGLELFLPLTVGARVVVVSRRVASDGYLLMTAMKDCGATVVQATPATWRLLLDAGWQGSQRLKILCGGEALARDLAQQLLPKCNSLWNLYGPTETTIWSSIYRVERSEVALLPIGRPIGNTQIYILDSEGNLVGIGAEGELYIGGDGVARGYLNRPELTAEKFVPDPFSKKPRSCLYRTGDLARCGPDGNLVFLGRIDHQVKIRGFRIELGEIEAVLSEHPDVLQIVVVAREDNPGDKRLVAYFVAGKKHPTAHELRSFLKVKLPEYMVPSAFVAIDALPLTPNGKVDRLALPAPTGSWIVNDFVPPRDPVEGRLANLWERVLRIRPIGATTNFFDLGVDSLTTARLFIEIDKVFRKDLPVSTLFGAPTVRQLANLLRDGQGADRWSTLVPIQPGGTRPPLFCVHGGTGATFFLYALANRLGEDQPLYGLQMEGLDGRRITRRYVEQMATHYLSEIRVVQPQGPYVLGGYCFGGTVAVEMAQQLRQKGEEAALVALFNAPNPAGTRNKRIAEDDLEPAQPEWGSRATAPQAHLAKTRHLRALTHLPLREKIPYICHALLTAIGWRLRNLQRQKFRPYKRSVIEAVSMAYVAINRPVPPKWRNIYMLHLTHFAERHYAPRFYPGKIIIFRGMGLDCDPLLGWSHLAAEIESCEIGGVHRLRRSMMDEPNVQMLAEELKAQLRSAG